MLVLTRKTGEKLIIGDDIEVQVLSVSGEQVKIGIKAPLSISVHRYEIYQAIKAANMEAAAHSTPPDPALLSKIKPQLMKSNE